MTYFTGIFKRSLLMINAVIFFLCCIMMPSDLSFCEDVHTSQDVYVSGGIADARILIPFFADDATSSSVCNFIYNGLTKLDKDLNIVGDLADRWEVEDGGLSITFYLRENVVWHDGEKFTAEDVRFTFEKIIDPETRCPYVSSYSDIKNITVIDPYSIRFEYTRPYAPALLKFGMGIIPEHIFKNIKNIRNSRYARHPVGTGSYSLTKWNAGQYIILEANPYYFEGIPGIEKYVYRIIPDQSVQFLELVTGGIDSMDLSPYQFFYRSKTPRFEKEISKYRYLAHSYTYIGYNLKDTLFKDVEVRRALSYAINRREIIDAVLLGSGEPCSGPFLKGTPYYNDSVEGYGYDPGKAISLLKQMGWKDNDGDGVVEKDGEEFIIRLATNQGNQIREDVATVVQRQWAEIGVKAEIQVLAWSAFLDKFISKKKFQAIIMGWTLPADPDLFSVWHTSSIRKGGLNFISYSNEELDDLIEKGRGEFIPESRIDIYKEIHRMISLDAPYTFLFFPYATPAVQKRFKGIDPAPGGIGYNFIDWYVPDNEVRYKF